MNIVLVLLALSTVLGFATGLRFKVFAIAAVSVLIAVCSALVLRVHGFGAASGIFGIVGCLVVAQTAYIAGVLCGPASHMLGDDVSGGGPGNDRQRNVSEDDEGHDRRPPWPPSAPRE